MAEHDSLARRPASIAKFILLLDRSPRLRAGALHALAYAPAVFSALLSLHVGALSLAPLLCGLAGGEV
jgi:hypothetical protein